MFTVKVVFYRIDKAPVTLDSKRVDYKSQMTVDEMYQTAENFKRDFLLKYPEMEKINNIGAHFDFRG